MKYLFGILLVLCLTGCSSLVPNEYLSVTPHADSTPQPVQAALTAEDYESLKSAILKLVRTGQTDGVIRVTNYNGDVATDLAEAAYAVSKQDPLGAYAVDYLTHSCTQIVSYYEIRINMTFRHTPQEISQISAASTLAHLKSQLQVAINRCDDHLALRMDNYRDQAQDIPGLVAEYCAANPATVIEVPNVSVQVYPDSGSERIVEINFTYTNTPEQLQKKQEAVQESLRAAAEYIRYRHTDLEKARLLYTYLTERFTYTADETVTPLYDALCSGIADPTGLSQAWQQILELAGVECYTVSGLRGGEPYCWNIFRADGYYRHLDLANCVLHVGAPLFLTDWDMTDYYWNTDLYPACNPVPAPKPPAETPPQEDTPAAEEEPETPQA